MSIDSIHLRLGNYTPIRPITSPAPAVESNKPQAAGGSFSEAFADAIKEVDLLQKDADRQIEGLVLEKEGATTHGAMMALEKADVAFQLMNNIRAKIIRAYEDVLRTQV